MQRTSNGLGNAINHVPTRPPSRNSPKRARGRSPRIACGQRHCDQRLNLLQDDRRHRIALHERLREQDRRERRRSRADDDRRGDVARAGAPEGRKGDHDDGEEDEDEDDVLAQDDRRRLGRLRKRAPEQRVGAPQSRRTATAATPMLALLIDRITRQPLISLSDPP